MPLGGSHAEVATAKQRDDHTLNSPPTLPHRTFPLHGTPVIINGPASQEIGIKPASKTSGGVLLRIAQSLRPPFSSLPFLRKASRLQCGPLFFIRGVMDALGTSNWG